MKPEVLAGLALVAAGAYGAYKREGGLTLAAVFDVSAWPGWVTIAGIGLLYFGSRGARK